MKKFLILTIFLAITLSAGANQDSKELEYLNLDWWNNYNDEILTEHLMTLYQQNYDLKNAQLKVKESEKLVKLQFANELPQLTFDGYAAQTFRSSVQKFGTMAIPSYAQNNFQLPLTASYEIDIWGKNHLRTKSAKEQLEMVKQAQRATYISLTSDFSCDYFNLIKADKLLEIQNELVKIQEEIVVKTQEKYKIGLCSINDVLAEKKILSAFKEEKNNLEDKKDVLENVLKAYLSNSKDEIMRKSYSEIFVLDNIPEKFNTDVIDNRPDYLQEEANLKRVGYDVKVAKKELLPSFVIFGQLGLNAYNFSDLFKTSTQLANAGIMPTLDIFSGGRKMAFLKLKKYQYDETLNNYQKTIVEDIKEVNTALSEFKTSKKNMQEAQERVKTQNNIFNLVQEKETIGTASKLDVLYAKEPDLITEKEKVSNTINYIIATISLYKSVGGKNLYKIEAL